MQAQADKTNNPIPTAVEQDRARRDATTKTLLETSEHVYKHKLSFRAYEHEASLLHHRGADVGECGHSRKTCREMSLPMFKFDCGQVVNFLKRPNPITKQLSHAGSAVDKQTDNGEIQSQMQAIRMDYAGTPLTMFWRNRMLDLDFDKEHEPSGFIRFNELIEGGEELGIKMFEEDTKNNKGEVIKKGDGVLVRGTGGYSRNFPASKTRGSLFFCVIFSIVGACLCKI